MKYKTRKRLAVELAAAQKTNIIYFDQNVRLQERIANLHETVKDLRSRLPKVVSLDTTGRLDSSMMPTGVDHEAERVAAIKKAAAVAALTPEDRKLLGVPEDILDGNVMPSPFGVIDAIAKTIDHEARPVGATYQAEAATLDRAVSNHAVARALDINCNDCEKCTEMRRRRTVHGRQNTETSERLLAAAHAEGHPRMSSWRPNGGTRPVSKYDTYGQNR